MFRPLKTHQLVVDLILAGLFAAIMLPIELSMGRMGANNVLSTAIVTLGMAGALALRRRSPGLALAVAWAAAIA
ncbi:MAG: sensor histidine kinase, partial [Actinobacteria bacterium]|nr:sensor histidine kinase [Actinomycetota bacterium]